MLQEVKDNDPEFDNAIPVTVYSGDSQEKIEENLIEILKKERWFLKEYWRNKKTQEVIEIHCGEKSIEIFNFGKELEDWQVEEITNAIRNYNTTKDYNVFGKVHYILVDNEQPINPRTNQPMNGYGELGIGEAIILYPSALEQKDHRVPKVSNLEGTVIHELSHTIAVDTLIDDWRKIFGWTKLEKPEKLAGGFYQTEKSSNLERCITDYAQTAADEDICESMVGALKNPDALDKEKIEYIRTKLLLSPNKNESDETDISIVKKKGEETKFPEIEQPIRYKKVLQQRPVWRNINV